MGKGRGIGSKGGVPGVLGIVFALEPGMANSLTEFRRPLRSNNTLWTVLSICIFFAGWIVPFAGQGGREPLGLLWLVLFRHDYIRPASEVVLPLAAITFVLSVISAIIGLLIQLLICGVQDYLRQRHAPKLENQEGSPENAS